MNDNYNYKIPSIELSLDFSNIKSKTELHEYLAKTMSFPDYYGKNLDALHDVLTDITEQTEITIHGFEELRESLGGYADRFMKVLTDSTRDNEKLVFITITEE